MIELKELGEGSVVCNVNAESDDSSDYGLEVLAKTTYFDEPELELDPIGSAAKISTSASRHTLSGSLRSKQENAYEHRAATSSSSATKSKGVRNRRNFSRSHLYMSL